MRIELSPHAIEVYAGAKVYVQKAAVAALAAATWNPRAMSDQERRGLERSLARWKLVDLPIFNVRTQELVGGHQRVQWLRSQSITEVAIVVLDLDEHEAKALNITLNDRRAQGHFVVDDLGPLLKSIEDGAPKLYADADLAGLLKSFDVAGHTRRKVAGEGGTPEGDDDELKPPETPRTREGDLWILGDHRLLCGDSERPESIELARGGQPIICVITDPPYAIYGSSTGVDSDVADDRMVRAFFEKIWGQARRFLPWEGHAYLFCDWRSYPAVTEGARRSKMAPRNMIVWDKSSGLGSNYSNAHELIAYHAKVASRTYMKKKAKADEQAPYRAILRPNVIRISKATGDDRPHNASKPVDLVIELIQNSTAEGEAVLDMFGGGGATLIACERSKRRAVMCEIDPRWCDVIAARWERETGKTAQLVPAAELAPVVLPEPVAEPA